MAYLWVLYSLFLFVKVTENPAVNAAELAQNIRRYHGMRDMVLEVVHSNSLEEEINQLLASYLTNKGFYVPDVLLYDENISHLNLGEYDNDDPKADRSINVDKTNMNVLSDTLLHFMTMIESLNLEYYDKFAYSLIFKAIDFQLTNIFNLLKMYELVDLCDAEIKNIVNRSSIKKETPAILNVLSRYRNGFHSHFCEWHRFMIASRNEMTSIAEKHKANLSCSKEELISGMNQFTRCEELKSHCLSLVNRHHKIKRIFDALLAMSKEHADIVFRETLAQYIQNLLDYELQGAKIFAKEIEKLKKILYKDILKPAARLALNNLQTVLPDIISFYKISMEKRLNCFTAMFKVHDDANRNKKLKNIFFHVQNIEIADKYTEALQLSKHIIEADFAERFNRKFLVYARIAMVFGLCMCAYFYGIILNKI